MYPIDLDPNATMAWCGLTLAAVDQNRLKFRELVYEMQAAPLEQVMSLISSSVRFFLATNTSIFMQVRQLSTRPERNTLKMRNLLGGYPNI